MPSSVDCLPDSLIDGYRAFRDGRLQEERARYDILAELGQRPKTMIIACCDSRASPETVFNAAPGELFVVRNVANLMPPYQADDGYHGTSAALEFAVQVLKVENIVVMGHGRCGGVQAYLVQSEGLVEVKPLSPGDFIGKWIDLLEPACKKMVCEEGDDFATRRRRLEEASIIHTLDNLMTFPCVDIQVNRGKIALHGAWFDISSGQLFVLNRETGAFSPIE